MYEFDNLKDFHDFIINLFMKRKFINCENRYMDIMVMSEMIEFDFLEMLPKNDIKTLNTIMPYNIVFDINKRMNKVKDGHKEWEERLILSLFLKYMPDIEFQNVIKYETPDFIVNSNSGVEVLSYKSKYKWLFTKYMRKRKQHEISLKELKRVVGTKEYMNLLDQMYPTLDKDGDTVLSYGIPGINTYTISKMKEFLFNEILKKKLNKYNNGDYQVFERNYLIVSLEFSTNLHFRRDFDLIDKINSAYKNIVHIYKLILIVIDNSRFTVIDLQNDTIVTKGLYEMKD